MDFKVLRTGHLVYRVRDIEKAKHLWIDTLGFDTSHVSGRGMYFLSGDVADNDHMVAIRPGKDGERMPDPDHQVGLATMSYEVASFADLKEAFEKITALGLETRDPVARGASYGFTFADYDGNLFELFCRRPPKERTETVPGPFAVTGSIEDRLAGAGGSASPGEGAVTAISVLRSGHLTLRARDLDRSKAFFERVFGLRQIGEHAGTVYLGNADSPESPLVAVFQATDRNAEGPACKNMFGMDHLAFEISDFPALKAAIRHLRAEGAPFDHIVDRNDGSSAYFRDPDGNLFEFYYFVPKTQRNPDHRIEDFAAAEGIAA